MSENVTESPPNGSGDDPYKSESRIYLYTGWLWFLFLFILMLGKVPGLDYYLESHDHGYQLSLGRQVLMGRFPAVDLIFYYGPMVAFTSAFGFYLHNSMFPETVICALGYTTAVFLIYHLVRKNVAARPIVAELLGMGASLMAVYECARFYKWYYWLFPLIVILCMSKALRRQTTGLRRNSGLFFAGFFAGFGALYRLDMGVASFSACILILFLLNEQRLFTKSLILDAGKTISGFILPFACWFLVLVVAARGSIAVYFSTYFVGAGGLLEYWRKGMPMYDLNDPLSPESALFLALILMFGSYMTVLGYGLIAKLNTGAIQSQHTRFLVMVAAMGLAIFPQGLHRVSISHTFQILPPFIVLVCVATPLLWAYRPDRDTLWERKVFYRRCVLSVLLVLLMTVVVGFHGRGGRDLKPFGGDLKARYAALFHGPRLGQGRAESEMAAFIERVQRACPEESTFLPFGYIGTSFLYERRGAGLFPYYMKGIYDTPEWLAQDMQRVESDSPSAVVTFRVLKYTLLKDIRTVGEDAIPEASVEATIDALHYRAPHVERLTPQLEYVLERFIYDASKQVPGFPWMLLTLPEEYVQQQ